MTLLAGDVALALDRASAFEADIVLVCAGREANTDSLDAQNAGLTAGQARRCSRSTREYRTKVPHIYAAGDVIGFPSLASTSMEQARVAVVDIFDLKYKTRVAPLFPYGIYTIPEMSMCRETEESLQKSGVPYVKGLARFSDNARGQMIGETTGA